MSENFNERDYGDYFKSLEENLKKEKTNTPLTQKEPLRQKKNCRKKIFWVFRLRKSVLAVILAAAVIVCAVLFLPKGTEKKEEISDTVSQTQKNENETVKKPQKTEKIEYKMNKNVGDILAENDAKTAIIIDKQTNTVIAARNAHKRTYPASTTKIMTLLVAAENIEDFSKTFTMSLDITDPLFVAEASVAGFLTNEVINMTDLCYGTILPSGADAAMGLAITVAGSEEEFVKLMNKKVKELGLKNTNFTNVTGLHNEENYSSAYDMAVILDAALQNDFCKEVLSTYQYTTAVTSQHPEGILLSSTLFTYMYGTEPETATILGGKTGFVTEAGYCIASYGKANETGNEYIVVTLGNSARMPAFFGQIDLYKHFCK